MILLTIASALAGDAVAPAQEVATAVQEGDCARALIVATEFSARAPTDPVGAKLLGDAHRCSGDAWHAARAYSRAQELGGTDPSLPKLIDSMSKSLGRLDLTLSGADPAIGLPRSELVVADAVLAPTSAQYPLHTWTLLPAGVPLELRVSGVGIPPVSQAIPALTAGETRQERIELQQQTPAVLVVAPWKSAGVTVELVQGSVVTPVPGGEMAVAAGPGVVRVHGVHGAVDIPVDMVSGQRTSIAVDDVVPGLLSVVGAPSGAQVVVAGPTTPSPAIVVAADGPLDAVYGLAVVTHSTPGLLAGTYQVTVKHPALGVSTHSAEVIAGEITSVRVDLASFPTAVPLKDSYAQWLASRKAHRKPPAVALAGGGGLLLGAGAATLGYVLYDSARTDVASERAEYESTAASDDLVAARAAYLDIGEARSGLRVPLAVLTVGGAVGVASGTFGGLGWVKHRKAHPVAAWEPEKLTFPPPAEPAPPAAPTEPAPMPSEPWGPR